MKWPKVEVCVLLVFARTPNGPRVCRSRVTFQMASTSWIAIFLESGALSILWSTDFYDVIFSPLLGYVQGGHAASALSETPWARLLSMLEKIKWCMLLKEGTSRRIGIVVGMCHRVGG
jgi:hypothetical protein